MLPKPPPRPQSPGFLYFPPFRVQGWSVAGEATAVMVPEFDVCFDIGVCHKPILPAKFVALSHGHMDHVAALPYYFSQRFFQGMGTGVCVCDARIAPAISAMMRGWVDVEQQQTSHEIIGLDDGGEVEVKNNIFLRGFHVDHTVPSMAYSLIERRTKLRTEFAEYPQSEIRRLKDEGVEITREVRIPLVTYIGDVLPGPCLMREEVLTAKVVIIECTFMDGDHRDRAVIGKHVHVDDIAELLPRLSCEALVLTHLSRRTNLTTAHKALASRLSEEDRSRVFILMDHKTNRARYESQVAEAERAAASAAGT